MRAAVRALEHEGVRRDRIRVHRANADGPDVALPSETGSSALRGGAVGVTLGLVWVVLTLVLTPPDDAFIGLLRGAATVASAGLFGALLGVILGAVRRRSRAGFDAYHVEVKDLTDSQARRVARLFERRGGELRAT